MYYLKSVNLLINDILYVFSLEPCALSVVLFGKGKGSKINFSGVGHVAYQKRGHTE